MGTFGHLVTERRSPSREQGELMWMAMLWEQQLGVYSEAGPGEDFFPNGLWWQPVQFHRESGKAAICTENAVAEAWNRWGGKLRKSG